MLEARATWEDVGGRGQRPAISGKCARSRAVRSSRGSRGGVRFGARRKEQKSGMRCAAHAEEGQARACGWLTATEAAGVEGVVRVPSGSSGVTPSLNCCRGVHRAEDGERTQHVRRLADARLRWRAGRELDGGRGARGVAPGARATKVRPPPWRRAPLRGARTPPCIQRFHPPTLPALLVYQPARERAGKAGGVLR